MFLNRNVNFNSVSAVERYKLFRGGQKGQNKPSVIRSNFSYYDKKKRQIRSTAKFVWIFVSFEKNRKHIGLL